MNAPDWLTPALVTGVIGLILLAIGIEAILRSDFSLIKTLGGFLMVSGIILVAASMSSI